EATTLLYEALENAGDDPALRARIELDLAYALVGVADFEGAAPHARQALTEAEQLGDPRLLGAALAVWAMLEFMLGHGVDERAVGDARGGGVHAARSAAEQGLAGCERTGWPVGVRWALAALGGLALSLGDAAGALEVLEPLTATVEAGGLTEPIVAFFLADAV